MCLDIPFATPRIRNPGHWYVGLFIVIIIISFAHLLIHLWICWSIDSLIFQFVDLFICSSAAAYLTFDLFIYWYNIRSFYLQSNLSRFYVQICWFVNLCFDFLICLCYPKIRLVDVLITIWSVTPETKEKYDDHKQILVNVWDMHEICLEFAFNLHKNKLWHVRDMLHNCLRYSVISWSISEIYLTFT